MNTPVTQDRLIDELVQTADWLCDTPPGSDQCDRGRRLLAALELVKGGAK